MAAMKLDGPPILVKLSVIDHAIVEEAARRAQIPLATYSRRATLAAARQDLKPRRRSRRGRK
jgi:hypothetical protein